MNTTQQICEGIVLERDRVIHEALCKLVGNDYKLEDILHKGGWIYQQGQPDKFTWDGEVVLEFHHPTFSLTQENLFWYYNGAMNYKSYVD